MAKSLFGGRKADALIPASNPASFAALFDPDAEQWSMLDLDDIEIQKQSREVFDEDSIAELARSIESIGQAVPVMVRRAAAGAEKPYILVAGERRCRALRLLGKTQVRAIIRTLDALEAAAIQAAENIHRENLTQMEQARMVAQMVETLGSAEAAARHFGKSPGWVSQQTMLLNLPPVTQRIVDENVSADLAVIAAVATVERTSGPEAAAQSVEKIKAAPKGKARDIAREAAREAKSKPSSAGNGKAASVAPADNARRTLAASPVDRLATFLVQPRKSPAEKEEIDQWLADLSGADLEAIRAHLRGFYANGERDRMNPGPAFMRGIEDGVFSAWGRGSVAAVAWLHGVAGRPFDEGDILLAALTV